MYFSKKKVYAVHSGVWGFSIINPSLFQARAHRTTATQKTKKNKKQKYKNISHIKCRHTKCCTMTLPHAWI